MPPKPLGKRALAPHEYAHLNVPQRFRRVEGDDFDNLDEGSDEGDDVRESSVETVARREGSVGANVGTIRYPPQPRLVPLNTRRIFADINRAYKQLRTILMSYIVARLDGSALRMRIHAVEMHNLVINPIDEEEDNLQNTLARATGPNPRLILRPMHMQLLNALILRLGSFGSMSNLETLIALVRQQNAPENLVGRALYEYDRLGLQLRNAAEAQMNAMYEVLVALQRTLPGGGTAYTVPPPFNVKQWIKDYKQDRGGALEHNIYMPEYRSYSPEDQ